MKLLSLLVLAIMLSGPSAFGDDGFFPEGYAQAPGESGHAASEKPNEAVSTSAPSPHLNQAFEGSEPKTDSTSDEAPEKSGTVITSIGVIVAGDESQHLGGVLNEYFSVLEQFPAIGTGNLVLVGDAQKSIELASPFLSTPSLSEDLTRKLALGLLLSPIPLDGTQQNEALDGLSSTVSEHIRSDQKLNRRFAALGNIALVGEVPSEYQITRSPAWILEAARGKILVEGIVKISSYLNRKGELVEDMLSATKEDGLEPIQ